jgi:putative transposase
MITRNLKTTNHSKHFLKCHLIFVCKYRKKLFLNQKLSNDMKQILFDVANKSDFTIEVMEVDVDHIHILVRYIPRLSISSMVNRLKAVSTNRIWKLHKTFLMKHFWKEHTFFTDGYFVSSIGYASQETIEDYIKQQG